MTKRYTILLLIIISVLTIPVKASEINGNRTHAQAATELIQRLETIKEMNIQSMSTEQQSKLKLEVQTIHTTLKTLDGGVYLSVGTIIIILLLILILF